MHSIVKVLTANPVPEAARLNVPVNFKPFESLLVRAARDLANREVLKFIGNNGIPVREGRGGFPCFLVIIYPLNEVSELITFRGRGHPWERARGCLCAWAGRCRVRRASACSTTIPDWKGP